MADKKKRQVLFEYLVDETAKQRIGTVNKSIEDGFDRMQKAIVRGGVAGTQELKKLEKESRDALKDVRDLKNGMKDLDDAGRRAFDAQTDSIKDFQKQIKLAQGDVRDFDDEFSQSRQRVALLGDVETGARTVGGAVGAFGGAQFAGVEQGIAVLSEAPAALEAIGGLGPAIRGAPDAIMSVGSSLGMTGLGLGAVAVAAAVTFKVLSDEMNRSAKAAEELVEAQKKQAQAGAELEQALIAGDLEAVAAQIGETLRQREVKQLELAQLENDLFNARVAQIMEEERLNQQAAEEFVRSMDEVDLRGRFDDANRLDEKLQDLFSPDQTIFQIRKLQDAVDDLHSTELRDLELAFGRQGDLLNQYGVDLIDVLDIVNESTEAEEDRGAAILAQAEAARQSFLKEQALLEQSTEQLETRLQAIENERTATELAVAELENSSQQTEEMTEKLAEYSNTLETLSQEQEFINQQALETARVREAEAEAAEKRKEKEEETLRAQEEFDKEVEASLKERAKFEQDFADDLVDISKKAADDSEKALEKLGERLSDLNRNLQRDQENQQLKANRKELEAQIKSQRAETDAFVAHRRTLLDIQQDADEQSIDMEQSRNFQGIFNLRRATRRRIQDEQKNLTRRNEDAAKERARARTDRARQFQDERNDRLRKFQQDISDANQQFAMERQLAQQNAIAAVMIRRQQFAQEQQDLFQQGGALLRIRQQFLGQEVSLIQTAAQAVGNLFSAIQSRQGQTFNDFSTFDRPPGGRGFSRNTENNVNAPITVNATPSQSALEVSRQTARALTRVVEF
jgi:hypothetical protein